jgi:hypothetical protein
MDEPKTTQAVVVTDVHMPFWSMVVFMVKWAFAAIPALIILMVIGFSAATVLGGIVGGLGAVWHKSSNELAPYSLQPQSTAPTPMAPATAVPKYAERCKGSPEVEKCIALERKLTEETADQRKARQKALDAERAANMSEVR